MSITSFYNSDELKVWETETDSALVQISGHTLIACPRNGSPVDGKADAARLQHFDWMREGDLIQQCEMSFGMLSCWANRRGGTWHSVESECGSCGDTFEPEQWRSTEYQRVLGVPFNRALVREALQYLYEVGTSCDRYVTLGLKPTGMADFKVLVMRCGEWSAIIMQVRTDDNSIGSDPLEAP